MGLVSSDVAATIGADARRWIGGAALAFAVAALALPFVGPSPLDFGRLMAREEPDWSILVQLRLSRTLLGLFGGAALALGGSVFQSMLRDALATPYTLGVSTGASLGAVIAIAFGWHLAVGVPGIWVGALGGAAVVLIFVVMAATRAASGLGVRPAAGGRRHQQRLLGADPAGARVVGDGAVVRHFPVADRQPRRDRVPGAVCLHHGRDGHGAAGHPAGPASGICWRSASRGPAREAPTCPGSCHSAMWPASLLAASTVALIGPIGFVGLVVPHLVRTRISADDRILMPCSFFLGGTLLASCDALGRFVLAPAEVPAGAITACIGGPYLIWLIRRRT